MSDWDTFLTNCRKMHGAHATDPYDSLFAVARTAADMLRDRGCAEVEALAADPGELRARMEAQEPVVDGSPHPRTAVFLLPVDRVSVKQVRTVLRDYPSLDAAVLVSLEGPTSFAKREVDATCRDRVHFFTLKELTYNVTRHHLVPPHRLAPAGAIGALDPARLPKLLATDPVARHYDFRPSDVVEIDRAFDVLATKYYRVVVDA